MIKYSKSDFLVWNKSISTQWLWTLNIWRKIAWVKGRTRFFFSLKPLRLPALILVGLKQIFSITVTWVRASLGGMAVCPADPLCGNCHGGPLHRCPPRSTVLSLWGLSDSPLNFHWRKRVSQNGKRKTTPSNQKQATVFSIEKVNYSFYVLSFTCMSRSDVMWLRADCSLCPRRLSVWVLLGHIFRRTVYLSHFKNKDSWVGVVWGWWLSRLVEGSRVNVNNAFTICVLSSWIHEFGECTNYF